MANRIPKQVIESSPIHKVTVALPSSLKLSLPSQILKDGYNMRQKSKWVVEAIISLVSKQGWENALLSELMVSPDAQDVYSIPEDVVSTISKEVHRVALINPSLNANRSSIIRAAINRRRLGFYNNP
jgi:hypothetical protein